MGIIRMKHDDQDVTQLSHIHCLIKELKEITFCRFELDNYNWNGVWHLEDHMPVDEDGRFLVEDADE